MVRFSQSKNVKTTQLLPIYLNFEKKMAEQKSNLPTIRELIE